MNKGNHIYYWGECYPLLPLEYELTLDSVFGRWQNEYISFLNKNITSLVIRYKEEIKENDRGNTQQPVKNKSSKLSQQIDNDLELEYQLALNEINKSQEELKINNANNNYTIKYIDIAIQSMNLNKMIDKKTDFIHLQYSNNRYAKVYNSKLKMLNGVKLLIRDVEINTWLYINPTLSIKFEASHLKKGN